MKRGKDDDKLVGPMFPRLHVNDTDKGGPRAPPRNKMALYEQFSIPTQRFNPGVRPPNPNNSSNTVLPASSSQGTGSERNYILPVHLPPQTPTRRFEKYISHRSLLQPERRKEIDEDDFRTPVYINSRIGESNDKIQKSSDGKKFTTMGAKYFGCSVEVQNDCDRDSKQFGSPCIKVRKDVRGEIEGLLKVSSTREPPVKSVKNILNGGNIDSLVKQAKVAPNQEYQECPVSSLSRLHQADSCLQQDHEAGSLFNDTRHGGVGLANPSRDTDKGYNPLPRGCFYSIADQNSPVEAIDDTEYHDTRSGGPVSKKNRDKSGSFSKISMADNLSILKVSPDDVVGIIGQKHFWKARKAISNQQRAFAVQVFELHRLMKVQRLIAGSPDLLPEDGTFLGKSPGKGSTSKKHSVEYVVKPRQQNPKHKDDSEKLNHKKECSAENAVGKTSLSSVKNGSHLSNSTPFSGNPHQANDPWFLQQSPGNQWLIPVMSPSEGLVYKPYPGPGFTATFCGGCGPFGPVPLGGAFMNPAYGNPTSHQGFGIPSDNPPGNHTYFPPYGIPVMTPAMSGSAVEQINQYGGPGSHGKNGYLSGSGGGANCNSNTHNQSSYNLRPVRKNGTTSQSQIMKFQGSKDSELQGSTASSPGEMAQGISSTSKTAEERDALSLFPMASPVVPNLEAEAEAEAEAEGASQPPLETRQKTQVIRVVPHNPSSATESAARIFQSIQEERKQYDSV